MQISTPTQEAAKLRQELQAASAKAADLERQLVDAADKVKALQGELSRARESGNSSAQQVS